MARAGPPTVRLVAVQGVHADGDDGARRGHGRADHPDDVRRDAAQRLRGRALVYTRDDLRRLRLPGQDVKVSILCNVFILDLGTEYE